jgi:hypothetical protein
MLKKAKKMLPPPPSGSPILLDLFHFVKVNKKAKNNCNNHKITKKGCFIVKKQLKNATSSAERILDFIEFIKFWPCKK